MRYFTPRLRLALTLACVTLPLSAAADAPAKPPKTGSFQMTIPERSKSSVILGITARLGWGNKAEVEAAAKKDGGEVDYNLSNETFDVVVPDDYTGDEPYGLLVWISPGRGGGPHREWLDVLRRHKLIWIGATNTGNDRTRWVRLGLAIDAADYMPKAYNIDPYRVYVSGASGGGRCSSIVAPAFPEVFTGGAFPIIGCDYFRLIEAGAGPDGRKTFYRRAYDRPSPKVLNVAMKERRFVVLTGDNDPNRPACELAAQAMKKDGFRYVTYLQVPGMGHQSPNAEWFEKGIVTLDEPRDAVAKADQAKEAKKPAATPAAAKQPAPTPVAAKQPAPPKQPAPAAPEASADDDADKLMRLARLYLDNRMYKKARDKLNELVKDHPSSTHVAEAKKLLAEIGTK